jgi:hypothetical protein
MQRWVTTFVKDECVFGEGEYPTFAKMQHRGSVPEEVAQWQLLLPLVLN